MLFLSAIFISFLGSLHPGMLTLTTAETTLKKGIPAGLLFAAGAAMVECVQCTLSLVFVNWLDQIDGLRFVLKLITSLVLLILAVQHFRQAPVAKAQARETGIRYNSFLYGMGLSALNLMVYPYWMVIGRSYPSGTFEILPAILYAIGASVGTFAAFNLYVLAGYQFARHTESLIPYTGKILSLVFLALALWLWLN